MKILHVVSSLDVEKGGVSAAVIGLANLCVQAGLDTRIAYTGDPRHAETELLKADAYSLSVSDGGLLGSPEITSAFQPHLDWADTVHVHAVWEPVQRLALKAALLAHKPIVFSPHGMLDRWSLNQKRLKKRLYLSLFLRRLFKRVTLFCATCTVESQMIGAQGFGRPIEILPLGVERSEFETLPVSGGFRKRLDERDREKPLMLFLSRIHPKKGVDILLEAFAKSGLKDTVHLSIAGPGEPDYIASLKSLAQSLGVSQSVSFPGMLFGGERIEALVDADLFVLPSHQENFGIAVLEAMACGTPVVVSDQVGLCEEVRHWNAGLVTRTDADEVAAAIGRVMTDAALQESLGNNGRNAATTHFYWDQLAEQWRHVYDRVVDMSQRVEQ